MLLKHTYRFLQTPSEPIDPYKYVKRLQPYVSMWHYRCQYTSYRHIHKDVMGIKLAKINKNAQDEWHPFAALGHSPPSATRRPGTLAALGHSPPWATHHPGPLATLRYT